MFNIFRVLTRSQKAKNTVQRTRKNYIHLPPGGSLEMCLPWETKYKDGTSEKGTITIDADVLRCSKKHGVTLEYTLTYEGGNYLGNDCE